MFFSTNGCFARNPTASVMQRRPQGLEPASTLFLLGGSYRGQSAGQAGDPGDPAPSWRQLACPVVSGLWTSRVHHCNPVPEFVSGPGLQDTGAAVEGPAPGPLRR